MEHVCGQMVMCETLVASYTECFDENCVWGGS